MFHGWVSFLGAPDNAAVAIATVVVAAGTWLKIKLFDDR